jgi:hypothetical protein
MLELLAMVTMLIDHIGVVFYPEEFTFRVIGRISFPIYIYLAVQGYRKTSNIRKYFFRLIILAGLSQIPYLFTLGNNNLNVIFTLLTTILILWSIDNIKKYKWLILVIVVGVLLLPYMDYGIYGVVLAFIYRFTQNYYTLLFHIVMSIICIYLQPVSFIQLFSILGTIILIRKAELPEFHINRRIYRYFYPAHLIILGLIGFMVKH